MSTSGMNTSGVYTKKQLVAMEFDDRMIERMLVSGDLIRLRPWWYATRLHDATVVSAVRDGGILTCVDALRFHGMWTPPGYRASLHLRRSKNKSGKHKACRVSVGAERMAAEAVDPLPVALKYASGCLPVEGWIAVADSYMNSTGTGAADLRVGMGTISVTLSHAVDRTDAKSQSGTESIARVRLKSEGYDVVVQPSIEGVGHTDLRIGKLLIECDSFMYHASRDDYERDHHRDRRALVDGWLTIRLTYDDIVYGWDAVLADIREITGRDRHRARTPKLTTMIEDSVLRTAREGL
ncbi:hypothetical protein L5I01_26965 [Gordonia sp. HY442]|uniref:hypothetical protein n=1 Tax=Gordonia zhenghanii TaxID=2911516 RepID=UPI001EEF7927|nr:hypothetical protein [Gordonia zhenghanii]MCF8607001.1 hypothetical protein [Gordonia zhenghanii]